MCIFKFKLAIVEYYLTYNYNFYKKNKIQREYTINH